MHLQLSDCDEWGGGGVINDKTISLTQSTLNQDLRYSANHGNVGGVKVRTLDHLLFSIKISQLSTVGFGISNALPKIQLEIPERNSLKFL